MGGTEDKLSQFADDTVIFLASRAGAQYLFDIVLPIYLRATGLKVNTAKKESLLLEALRNTKKTPASS